MDTSRYAVNKVENDRKKYGPVMNAFKVMRGQRILDACCGGRMFWFNKKHPDAIYMDNRKMSPKLLENGQTFEVNPDIVGDFRDMPFPDEQFSLVVFDPPHLVDAGNGYMRLKYGSIDSNSWQEDLRAGFSECFRVLRPDGILIFKWNETDILLRKVLELTPHQPLFGHPSGKASKTHWVTFMKT